MPPGRPLRNYYKILGIDKSASDEEIRASYRRLAKKFHPDVSKSDDSEFWMQVINEAYDVLGDKRKRALYDYIFFADSQFSSQGESEDIGEATTVRTPRKGGFRNVFSHLIVAIIRLQDSSDLILMVLAIFAASLYLVFDRVELAAGMIALLFVLATIYLMIRVVAEIFSWVGIREEAAWFDEAFRSASYLLEGASDRKTNEHP